MSAGQNKDFATCVGKCVCLYVGEWNEVQVWARQSGLISDSCVIGCNGGWKCVCRSAVIDVRFIVHVVMLQLWCGERQPDHDRAPPTKERLPDASHTRHNPGGRWSGGGTGGERRARSMRSQ